MAYFTIVFCIIAGIIYHFTIILCLILLYCIVLFYMCSCFTVSILKVVFECIYILYPHVKYIFWPFCLEAFCCTLAAAGCGPPWPPPVWPRPLAAQQRRWAMRPCTGHSVGRPSHRKGWWIWPSTFRGDGWTMIYIYIFIYIHIHTSNICGSFLEVGL